MPKKSHQDITAVHSGIRNMLFDVTIAKFWFGLSSLPIPILPPFHQKGTNYPLVVLAGRLSHSLKI
jgi:hypothetical protein